MKLKLKSRSDCTKSLFSFHSATLPKKLIIKWNTRAKERIWYLMSSLCAFMLWGHTPHPHPTENPAVIKKKFPRKQLNDRAKLKKIETELSVDLNWKRNHCGLWVCVCTGQNGRGRHGCHLSVCTQIHSLLSPVYIAGRLNSQAPLTAGFGKVGSMGSNGKKLKSRRKERLCYLSSICTIRNLKHQGTLLS